MSGFSSHRWTGRVGTAIDARRVAASLFGVAGALLLGTATLAGQSTSLVMPRTPLLPQHFAEWAEVSAPADDADANGTLPIFSDPTLAAVVREDGLLRTAIHSYTRAGRGGAARLQAMQFQDATGAVAAYTFLRSRQMHETASQPGVRNDVNIATLGSRALLRDGVSVVVADNAAGISVEDLRALGRTMPKISGPRGLPPLLPTYLPGKDLVAGSMAYAVGGTAYKADGGVLPPQLIGFDKAGEAATGEYAVHGGTGRMTLLLLPTPQIAGERGHAIEQWLNSPEGRAASLGTVKLRRLGPMLILVTGAYTADEAKQLADAIHLRTELTWNKPLPLEFHTEVRKTASLLTSILVFSGVLGLASVLLGLFLGFGRAWIRVMMGKPAASEPEFLRLDLRSGGAGSPVSPE